LHLFRTGVYIMDSYKYDKFLYLVQTHEGVWSTIKEAFTALDRKGSTKKDISDSSILQR